MAESRLSYTGERVYVGIDVHKATYTVTCVCQRVDIDVHQRREGAVLRLDQRSVSRG